MSRKTILVLALAITMAFPAASAEWRWNGGHEPDNALDDPSFMQFNPPVKGDTKLYFAVISSTNGVGNPNVGLLQSQVEPPAYEFHTAILGVWMDCNGDGYVGHVETALSEYSSSLLLDTTTCPPGKGSTQTWAKWNYNWNGWVTEFIPVAGKGRIPVNQGQIGKVQDTRLIPDDESMVWGDFGRPDEDPFHRSCALAPQPRGTYQSTGGAVNFVDCRADVLGTWNDAVVLAGQPGLAFADEDDATVGAHPLDMGTFGSEDSQYSAVQPWDCSSDPLVSAHRDVSDDLPGAAVYRPAANPVSSTSPTTWTVPATYNATREGIHPGDGRTGDCNTSNDRGAEFYGAADDEEIAKCALYCVGEADFNGVDPKNKREADWNFNFTVAGRGGAPWSVVPGGAGTAGMSGLGTGLGSYWATDSAWASKPGPRVTKGSVVDGSLDIADAYYLTFYAHVGAATLSAGATTPGGSRAYGAVQCAGETSGIHHGWNCDKNTWYVNPDGSTIPEGPQNPILARPGQLYELRDVDCYDGSLLNGAVGVMPAYYGTNPCA